MNLSFLKDVKLDPVEKTASKKSSRISYNAPEDADLRLYANGVVIPSKEFAQKHDLEFQPKENIAEDGQDPIYDVVGNGLDIFSSLEWGMIKGKLPADQELLFFAAVPKRLHKVDMWASTKYEDDNTPKASVFTQGANVFSKGRFKDMVAETYNVNWDATEYVDFQASYEDQIASPNGIYTLPKVVAAGTRKGQPDYVRRENLEIYPLVIAHAEVDPTKGEVESESEPEADVKQMPVDSPETVDNTAKEDSKEVAEVSAGTDTDDWAASLGKNPE